MKNVLFITFAIIALFLYVKNDDIATFYNPNKLTDTEAYDAYIYLKTILVKIMYTLVLSIVCLSEAFDSTILLIIILTILFSYSTSDLFSILVLKEKYFQGVKDYISMIIMAIIAIYKFRKKIYLYINTIKSKA